MPTYPLPAQPPGFKPWLLSVGGQPGSGPTQPDLNKCIHARPFPCTGRRLVLLMLTITACCSSVWGQDTTRRWNRPNLLKTNLLAPISLIYERAITHRFALQANVRWFNFGGLSQSDFVNAAVEGRFFLDGSDQRRLKSHPTGFYIGPYLKARSLHYINEIGQGLGKETARDEVFIRSLGVGALVGHQWVGRRGFSGDLFVGGGAMPYALSQYTHTLRYSPVTSDVGYDYYALDFRIGVSLGYAF